MVQQYRYVKIRGKYFCLQQNPVALIWFLYFTNNRLYLNPEIIIWFLVLFFIHKSFQVFSYCLASNILRNRVKKSIKNFLYLHKKNILLELPIYGNVGLPVQKGYKVFDFRRRSVVKIFEPNIALAVIVQEIEKLQNASLFDFAPTIRSWSIEELWYEEDYYATGNIGWSIPRLNSVELINLFYKRIMIRMECLMLSKTSLTISVAEHVSKTREAIEKSWLLEDTFDQSKTHQVINFVASTVEQLALSRECQINLVFSHGDFCLVNILRIKDEIIVIDWESAGYRSILHDFYNYFLSELFHENTTAKTLSSQIHDALSCLQLSLAKRVPDMAETLVTLAQLYRRIYYLERVCMLLERKPTDKELDIILRSINVFNHYEAEIGSSYPNLWAIAPIEGQASSLYS